MVGRMLTVCLCGLLLHAGAVPGQDASWKPLLGQYKLKAMSVAGKPVPDSVTSTIDGVTIEQGEFTISVNGKLNKAKLELDFKPTPGHLSMKPENLPKGDDAFLGLFQQDKGTLTIVYSEAGKRPKDLTDTSDKTVSLVLQKVEK